MFFDDFWKRFVSFGFALALGLYAAAFFYGTRFSNIFVKESNSSPKTVASTNHAMGSAVCYPPGDKNDVAEKTAEVRTEKTTGVKITSKPRAFTNTEGRFNEERLKPLAGKKVVLRVTFEANGEIGAISVISGLSDNLTEEAIEAAKAIKFEPATRNGAAISVTKPVEYNFTIY